MSTTYNITEKTGYTYARMPSSFEEARTFQDDRFRLDKTAAVAEANFIIRDAHTRYFRTIGLPEIGDDYSDEEQLEWNTFFAQPHFKAELQLLAKEHKLQFTSP